MSEQGKPLVDRETFERYVQHAPTTDEVREYIRAADRVTAHVFAGAGDNVDEFDRWLAAHDTEVRGAERERIIQDMQERAHPDDWGVPCVYVETYAKRLREQEGAET